MKIYDAVVSEKEMCSWHDSCGRIAAEYCYAYPPDIPIIVPGEMIKKEIIEEVDIMIRSGLTVVGIENGMFKVVKED